MRYLKRTLYVGSNVYFAGFKETEIPEEYRTDDYLGEEVLDVNAIDRPLYRDAAPTDEISLVVESPPLATDASFPSEPPVVVEPNEKIEINKASIDLITTIPKITRATATKIVESRDEKLFESIEDIKERFPKVDWDSVSNNLIF
ncbi:MAG: helix-hairpin-helix domain-containing protein [Waterburya sp.]